MTPPANVPPRMGKPPKVPVMDLREIEEDNEGIEGEKWKVRDYVSTGFMYEIIQEKLLKRQTIKMIKKNNELGKDQ